ncbi:MAG: ABC transporter ATP-binding protein [Oscillospiraceae bacterium]|nr:ABC transporter ATP-binding protein [Oscillospiraceae bacterium]
MLKVESINAFYGDVQTLFNVSLEVERGEIVTILGSNGAGKTTLIKSICNLLPIRSGEIYYEGIRLDKEPAYNLVNLGISLIPEGRRLFPDMSVMDNLLLGAYALKTKKQVSDNLEWVMGLFPWLKERAKQTAGTLSGGEQQMCAIARGLMIRPKMIIFDEPSLGLAPIIVDQIFETLTKIVREQGSTALLIEQNAQTALEVSDRGYVLENGHMVFENTSDKLLKSPEIQKSYLGM